MKKYGLLTGSVLLFIVLCSIGYAKYANTQREHNELEAKVAAEKAFNRQLENNWDYVLQDMNLIELRANDPKNLRSYSDFQYKRLGKVKFSPAYRNQADEFMTDVHRPVCELYKKMATPINKEKKDRLILEAKEVDSALASFSRKHPGFIQPSVRFESVLETNMAKLLPADKPATTRPEIIVVHTTPSYPNWIQTAAQRTSWDSMKSIASDYFKERHRLSLDINWATARRNPSYLLGYSIQSKLDQGISMRQNLLSRLEDVEMEEGMTTLSERLKSMLQNSLWSLEYAKKGDYASFKSVNNANDRIQNEIRRTFKIR